MPLKLNQDELPTINLTSLIDILFLLIIFFMVGTRFTESETNIQINSPKVDSSGAMLQRPASKVVYLQGDGAIQFEGQRVTPEQLTSMLVQSVRNYPDTTVQIKPDGTVTMSQAAAAYMAVKRSGAKPEGLTFASAPTAMPRR
ncbi:MAG: biopolymer transporter ExbD [Pirellula sp.]